jgi:thioredoxin-dependent peroxiredoxin
MKELKVGDKMPLFGAKDQNGNDFFAASIVGKKVLVIFFYPKNETPACTKEACSFRDKYQDIKDAGAEVIGISGDSEKSHQKFAKNHNLQYILLSDSDRKLRQAFGVPTSLFGLLPGRVTYVVDLNGTIQMVYNSISDKGHVSNALATIKKIV